MNGQIAAAWQRLDHANRATDELHPATIAHLEQHAAAAKHALHIYGVDLDDPRDLTVVLAVVDLTTRASALTDGITSIAAVIADLQQALIATTRPTDRSST